MTKRSRRAVLRAASAVSFVLAIAGLVYLSSGALHGPSGVAAEWVAPAVAALSIAGVGSVLVSERQADDRNDRVQPGKGPCPACGREVLDHWRMCPYCGAMLETGLSSAPTSGG